MYPSCLLNIKFFNIIFKIDNWKYYGCKNSISAFHDKNYLFILLLNHDTTTIFLYPQAIHYLAKIPFGRET